MVAFWPWGGDSSSTASFEKTLSTLSKKINEDQARLDKARNSSRRARLLSTLYLTFAYLVYAIVLLLVIGYKNLGPVEWTGTAGGPLLIYLVRNTVAAFYNFRIESLSTRLKEHQTERAKTIQKLKDATKYDSTMELIEKYGGVEGKPGRGRKNDKPAAENAADGEQAQGKEAKEHQDAVPGRTAMPPPPTANIPRYDSRSPPPPIQYTMDPGAEFAPNAEFAPSSLYPSRQASLSPAPPSYHPLQSAPSYPAEPHWYDRIFDVLLGEDETAPKNRIVLLCSSCRLVNGQAPPGCKSLSDVGSWRCMSCGATNNRESEGKRIVNEVLSSAKNKAQEVEVGEEFKPEEDDADVGDAVEQEAAGGPAAGVKKRRGKDKK